MKLKVAGKKTGLAWTTAIMFMPVGALVCNAGPITYKVNRTVGAGTITGFIETDGTTSAPLTAANIVDWNLTETDGMGNSLNLTGPNSGSDSQLLLMGNDLTATVTDLYFNFSGGDSGFFGFQEPPIYSGYAYYCDDAISNTFDCEPGESVAPISVFSDIQNVPLLGNVIIATNPAPQGPTPTVTSVINAVSLGSTLCPGLVAAVFGSNFGTNFTNAAVMIGGQSAYVYSTGYSPAQMQIQIPFGLSAGPTTLTVSISGVSSSPFAITLSAASPALTTVNGMGTGLASILVANTTNQVSLASPATPGQTLTAVAVGLGATNPVTATGVATVANPVATLPTVTVGGINCKVTSAAVYPGQAGYYQISFTLPSGVQGTLPLVISTGGLSSSSTVTIPIAGLSAVVNNASFANPGTIAPGTIASVFVNGIGSASTENLMEFPNISSEGVQITFNGTPAPMFHLIPSTSASLPSQIDLYVPDTLPTAGTVNVQLTTSSADYPNYTLNMVPADPGFYRLPPDPKTGAVFLIAQFTNSTWLVSSVSTAANLGLPACTASTNPLTECAEPANIGDYLTIYMTGLGLATVNGSPTGAILTTGLNPPANGSVLYETPAMPTVTIGGVPAIPLYSGLAPGFAGEYQLDVQIPAGVVSGDSVPVVVTMMGASDTANISVQPGRVPPPNQ